MLTWQTHQTLMSAGAFGSGMLLAVQCSCLVKVRFWVQLQIENPTHPLHMNLAQVPGGPVWAMPPWRCHLGWPWVVRLPLQKSACCCSFCGRLFNVCAALLIEGCDLCKPSHHPVERRRRLDKYIGLADVRPRAGRGCWVFAAAHL